MISCTFAQLQDVKAGSLFLSPVSHILFVLNYLHSDRIIDLFLEEHRNRFATQISCPDF